jgi:transposase
VGQVAVYSGVERRRRWDDETRLKILSEAFAPGANIAQVARRHDVSTGQIYTWRRKLLISEPEAQDAGEPGFAEAVLVEGAGVAPSCATPAIVIDLARGRRVTIFASAPSALVSAALRALR